MCLKPKKSCFEAVPDNLTETLSRNFPVGDGVWKGSIVSRRLRLDDII